MCALFVLVTAANVGGKGVWLTRWRDQHITGFHYEGVWRVAALPGNHCLTVPTGYTSLKKDIILAIGVSTGSACCSETLPIQTNFEKHSPYFCFNSVLTLTLNVHAM
uniref:Uncharacterized protein n=1 Tax=Anguilla anguilla TaxID=7936 RepID=A0A0E9WP28_ANGAN